MANALPFGRAVLVQPGRRGELLVELEDSAAALPGLSRSTPIFRKSAPTLKVWVPTNFEKLPLAPDDF